MESNTVNGNKINGYFSMLSMPHKLCSRHKCYINAFRYILIKTFKENLNIKLKIHTDSGKCANFGKKPD